MFIPLLLQMIVQVIDLKKYLLEKLRVVSRMKSASYHNQAECYETKYLKKIYQ